MHVRLTGESAGVDDSRLWRKSSMITVESYSMAVAMCVVTMLCWGSWANTQKLATQEWRFQLFYWDYAIGVFLLPLLLAFTLARSGSGGRSFLLHLLHPDRQPLRTPSPRATTSHL